MAKLGSTIIYGNLNVDGDIGNKATTTTEGVVQLNDATNSTSTTQAATANAVKKAYDLAAGKEGAFSKNSAFNKNFETTVGNIKVAGTASIGSLNTIARADHIHPAQTSVSGNAGTATKLQTTRSINGTNFDGSANITTANWGTARNLTIGNTAKSVNGSGNVSWSLSEIGAAAASHGTHVSYGGNGTATTVSRSDHTHPYVPSSTGGNILIHADSDSSSTGEYIQVKAGHNVLQITSSAGGGTVTQANNKITYNGHAIYHAGQKPTAGDIGALASNGTAVAATKLQTTRAINGTNFDGSANITTANWGTARNLTIGNTAKSVNGSANVAWSLGEIGAAAASHTHLSAHITDATASATPNMIVKRDGNGDFSSRRITSTIATGTSPFVVTSTTVVSNLNADTVDGLHSGSIFRKDTGNDTDVRLASADGRGLRFWDSDNYKIWMSSVGNGTYGGRVAGDSTSDYNMYFRMKGGTRGYVFQTDSGNVAGITKDGNIKAKGSVSVGDNKCEMKYNSSNECIEFIFN